MIFKGSKVAFHRFDVAARERSRERLCGIFCFETSNRTGKQGLKDLAGEFACQAALDQHLQRHVEERHDVA
jgi:hypothetical protein